MSCELAWVGISKWWCEIGASGQAAWVQGIGSIIAIGVAIYVPYWQRKQRRKDKAELNQKIVMSAAANLSIALSLEETVFDWAPKGDGQIGHDFSLEQAKEFMLLRPKTNEVMQDALQKSHYFSRSTCEQIVKFSISAAAYERVVEDMYRRTSNGNADEFLRKVACTNDKINQQIKALRESLSEYLPEATE